MSDLHKRLDGLIRRCGEVTENLEFGGSVSPDTYALLIAELAGIVKELVAANTPLGDVSAPSQRVKPSIAIRNLLNLHIAEQEGMNPPTPQEWIDAVDRAAEALGEVEALERSLEEKS